MTFSPPNYKTTKLVGYRQRESKGSITQTHKVSGFPVKDEILEEEILKGHFKVSSEERRTLKQSHLWKKHHFWPDICFHCLLKLESPLDPLALHKR